MAMMGQPRAWKRKAPKITAATRNAVPSAMTRPKDMAPLPVRRLGPVRLSPSAPFFPSTASLKKFVAIWMQRALRRVQVQSHGSRWPVRFQARTPPSHTGTMPAGRVFGRVAERTAVIHVPRVICGGD